MKLALLSAVVLFMSYAGGVCIAAGGFWIGAALVALAFAGQFALLGAAANLRLRDLRDASRALDALVEEARANG